MVSDAEHGKGIGTLLVEHLAAAARNRGIVRFTADVLPENTKMRTVFRDAGFDVEQHTDQGVVEVAMSTTATTQAIAAADARECAAESASLRPDALSRAASRWSVLAANPAASGEPCCAPSSPATTPGTLRVIHPQSRRRSRASPPIVRSRSFPSPSISQSSPFPLEASARSWPRPRRPGRRPRSCCRPGSARWVPTAPPCRPSWPGSRGAWGSASSGPTVSG